MNPPLPLLVAVIGPTGSGKSDLALEIGTRFDGEIVNCDSVQLYRFLDIGTAKTPPAERRGVPHHLIDVLSPDEVFTAGDYSREARRIVREIAGRGRLPVIAGGTGFYLRAFLHGLFEGPARDEELRARLSARNPASLHKLLCRFDAAAGARIHPNDRQKLIRALEICIRARQPMTAMHAVPPEPLTGFDVLKIGLDPPREQLYERINRRCEQMFRAGLVEEVRALLGMGYSRDAKGLEAIGYAETLAHLQGELSLPEAVAAVQQNTRRYAKRQLTWFRREARVHWLHGFGNQIETITAAIGLVSCRKKSG